MAETLYLGSDFTAAVASVTVGGAAATTGTGTWTLYDPDGTQLGTGAMSNDGAGNLSGTIESSVFSSQTAGDFGTLTYVFAQGAADTKWVTDVEFKDRGFSC